MLIDETALARLQRLGGTGFVRQMLELFIEYAPKRLAAARTGQQARDLTVVADSVHPLKSSAGQIGAKRISALAAEIESLARAGQSDCVSARLTELEAVVEQVKTHLAAKLKELPS